LRRLKAYTVYLLMEGISSFLFWMIFTINMVYQVETVGLNPLQLVLVGTTLEATVFLLEIPTGVVADVYSRRLSVIIGIVLIGVGFMVEGSFPRFEAILLAPILWGTGYTFTSGAGEAWIADEVGEARAGAAYLRASQVGQLGALAATGASVVLANVRLNLPIVAGGVLFVGLACFLALVMPETGFRPIPLEKRSTWGGIAQTLRDGLRMVRRRRPWAGLGGLSGRSMARRAVTPIIATREVGRSPSAYPTATWPMARVTSAASRRAR
jgi:DHA3 family tetracycline resistance protein-like MFS transporter